MNGTATHQRHVLMTLQGAIQRVEGEAQTAWGALANDHREEAQLVFEVREKLLEAANMLEAKMWPGRKFPLGRLVMTQGARALIADPQAAEVLLERHASGEWGDLDPHDKQVNEDAVKGDARILSKYAVNGASVYVITEADRSTTTMMRPEEY